MRETVLWVYVFICCGKESTFDVLHDISYISLFLFELVFDFFLDDVQHLCEFSCGCFDTFCSCLDASKHLLFFQVMSASGSSALPVWSDLRRPTLTSTSSRTTTTRSRWSTCLQVPVSTPSWCCSPIRWDPNPPTGEALLQTCSLKAKLWSNSSPLMWDSGNSHQPF